MTWTYERMNDKYEPEICPRNDWDGEITGKIIINLPSYFDENPELRKSLGWIKHLHLEEKDIGEYNPQTQNVRTYTVKVDDYTIKDEYIIEDKTEEELLFEELGFARSGFSMIAHGNTGLWGFN